MLFLNMDNLNNSTAQIINFFSINFNQLKYKLHIKVVPFIYLINYSFVCLCAFTYSFFYLCFSVHVINSAFEHNN